MKDTREKIIDLVNKAIPIPLIQRYLGCTFKEVMVIINEIGGTNLPKINTNKHVNVPRKASTSRKRWKSSTRRYTGTGNAPTSKATSKENTTI